MKLNKLLFYAGIFSAVLMFAGCTGTDVVAKGSVTSFDELVKSIPDQISESDNLEWILKGPDNKESLIVSKDFGSSQPDIVMEVDAEPFFAAGLDLSKLPGEQYSFFEQGKKIRLSFEYGTDKFDNAADKSVLDTFKQIVKIHRNIIGYHEEGDHYKIILGNGNSFAWAKDLSSNKTDMAFILNPQPLIEAGVNTEKLKEWAFTKMPVTDKDGKPSQVDVFIKSFNIK